MKTLLTLLLLITLTASAQYRYNSYTFEVGTCVSTNAVSNFNSSVSIAQGNSAQIQIAFNMRSPTTNYFAVTNPVIAKFDLSVDGSHWTNSFLITSLANSNNEVWSVVSSNVDQWAWLRLVCITNLNTNAFVTNHSVFVGQKVGL